MNSEKTDVELIKNIVNILNSKTEDNCDFNIDEAWETFVNEYSESSPIYSTELLPNSEISAEAPRPLIKLLPFLRTAIVAAILLSLLIGSAYAAGLNIFKIVADWTSEVFGFIHSEPQEDVTAQISPQAKEGDISSDLKTVLAEYGIVEKLVPNYLPEGFEQTEFYVDETEGGNNFTAVFAKGEESICIQIQEYKANGLGTVYEKDEGNPEIYKKGGISHYIMTNMGIYKAVWLNGKFECTISGLTEKNELIKIIDSIYEE